MGEAAAGLVEPAGADVVGVVVAGGGPDASRTSVVAMCFRAVPGHVTAAANGFNNLTRSLGTSTATALSAAVFAAMTVQVGPTVLPSLTGIRVTLAVAAVFGLLGLLVTLVVPVRDEPQPDGRPLDLVATR